MAKDWWIKFEVGAWEKDVNMISLEAEGALLKLTLKLYDSPLKGRFDFAFDSLSKLFKTTPENALKIIHELKRNNILNIEFLPDDIVRVESRRLLKEAEKSRKNSENGKQGGRGKKKTESETKAKLKPNESESLTINSYYNSNSDSSDLGESAQRGESPTITLDEEFCSGIMTRYAISRQDFDHMLEQFELSRVEKSIIYDSATEMKAGFQRWVNSWIRNEKVKGNGVTTFRSEDRNPANRKSIQDKIMDSYAK